MEFKWSASEFENEVPVSHLSALKKWNESQKELAILTEEQLVCFYLACDGCLEFTKKTIEENLKIKKNHPKLFSNRYFSNDDIKNAWECVHTLVFPKRTPDDCAIIYQKLRTNSLNYTFEGSMQIFLMSIEYILYEKPPKAFIFFVDCEKTTWRNILKINYTITKALIQFLEDGLPIKLKAIHLINIPKIFYKIFQITRPWMKEGLIAKQILHEKDMDINEFYKIIPQNCLPEEYGGSLPNLEELRSEMKIKFEKMSDFFEHEENQRI